MNSKKKQNKYRINKSKKQGEEKIKPDKNTARTAGLLYLLFLLTGIFSFFYVPSKIFVDGNAALTASNIINFESLFRIGIVINLVGQIIFLFLALTLYKLFKDVDKKYAKLMVILVAVSIPVAFLIILIQIIPLMLLSGTNFLNTFSPDQINTLVMLFLNLYNYGMIIIGIFWGLWLYPFGYLVIKSGFIPKILGIFLIMGCFGFQIDSFSFLLIPNYYNIITNFALIPGSIGEISMIFWLLIKGIKDQQSTTTKTI